MEPDRNHNDDNDDYDIDAALARAREKSDDCLFDDEWALNQDFSLVFIIKRNRRPDCDYGSSMHIIIGNDTSFQPISSVIWKRMANVISALAATGTGQPEVMSAFANERVCLRFVSINFSNNDGLRRFLAVIASHVDLNELLFYGCVGAYNASSEDIFCSIAGLAVASHILFSDSGHIRDAHETSCMLLLPLLANSAFTGEVFISLNRDIDAVEFWHAVTCLVKKNRTVSKLHIAQPVHSNILADAETQVALRAALAVSPTLRQFSFTGAKRVPKPFIRGLDHMIAASALNTRCGGRPAWTAMALQLLVQGCVYVQTVMPRLQLVVGYRGRRRRKRRMVQQQQQEAREEEHDRDAVNLPRHDDANVEDRNNVNEMDDVDNDGGMDDGAGGGGGHHADYDDDDADDEVPLTDEQYRRTVLFDFLRMHGVPLFLELARRQQVEH